MSRIPPKTILITGATSGIGKALALHYANNGTTLCLTGRNQNRLEDITSLCEKKGATVHSHTGDITIRADISQWIKQCDQQSPIDLVIANAGISAGTADGSEPDAQVAQIFATNIDGVLNTIQPIIPNMKKRKSGSIAIISSLAAYRALPSSPAYSASKAAVKTYGEALRGHLKPFGVNVTVITPGYIKTPMTDVNEFPMPFIVPVDKAATIIAKRLQKNPARIAFPFPLYFVTWLMGCLSPSLTDPIFAKLPGKKTLTK